MNITDIRIFPVGDAKLKAFVSIIIDHSFLISGIKVIEGATGLFLSMPSKKRKDGTFKDIAHPLNQETRTWMEKTIIAKYNEVLQASPDSPPKMDLHENEIHAEPAPEATPLHETPPEAPEPETTPESSIGI
jgi:stage V sporulation protein G